VQSLSISTRAGVNRAFTHNRGMRGQSKRKRLIKLLISAGFLCGMTVWNWLRRLCGREPVGSSVVLCYHSVPSKHKERFARQMSLIVRLATPLRADVRLAQNGDARYVAVTFDDGYENLLQNAMPELEKRRIPSTIFVIASALGEFPYWFTSDSDRKLHGKLMSAEQLKRLPSELVTIGSHTVTHPELPHLDQIECRREIFESRERLEKLLHIGIKLFAFPFGAFSQELLRTCREAGYERVFTNLPYRAFAEPQEFVCGRVWAEPIDWCLEFRLKILGAYQWLPFAIAMKRRIRSAMMTRWRFPRRAGAVGAWLQR
jgi:peptidoglycan/xylan/chitin deacetylase (PgdA/CDA1 family)